MSHHSPPSLYCNEELADDLDSIPSSTPPISISDESSFIERLLDSEHHHMPHPDYLRLCQNRSINLTSRQDSINFLLKVHARCQFKPVTAFLSINYFDRFLSSHTLPESGWPFQLLSVACLSLAAKMEEMDVPLLMDLQMLESAYVFEPKTIQRMELCVMASLNWRLRSVTPFDYIHYFISKFPSSSAQLDTIQSLASALILNTTRVIDFLRFPPSVIAAAAVISTADGNPNLPESFDERVNREMVRSCHQLMEEYLLDTCPSDCSKDISIQPTAPPSPIGVLDAAACVSCDTHSENPASGSGSGSGSGSASGEAKPEIKRQRLSKSDFRERRP